jgi:uncharacterized protein
VAFAWQGGEPTLLGLDFFRRAVELQNLYRPDGLQISNSLQTNGTLLDAEWVTFLAQEGFLVGISIDGPRSMHNPYRVDRAGRPTFDATMRGLDLLRGKGVDYNILTTVHRANASKGKQIYRFLRKLGSAHLQFIPIVERCTPEGGGLAGPPQIDQIPNTEVTDWSVRPLAYGKFLCDVFDLWYKQDLGRIFVQHFETQLGLWMGQPASLCVFAETCGNALAMEHNGDIYACDHYVHPAYRLGNLMQTPLRDLVWSEQAASFGRAKRDQLTSQCRNCSFRFACNGGCPKHRFAAAHDGEQGHNYLCPAYMKFFRHAGDRLTKLARGI